MNHSPVVIRRRTEARGLFEITALEQIHFPATRTYAVHQQLLRAAMENGGELTVSQGVLATGKTFEQIEKALNGMSDKGYVDVDNAPGTGVLVYRFPDLLTRPRSG